MELKVLWRFDDILQSIWVWCFCRTTKLRTLCISSLLRFSLSSVTNFTKIHFLKLIYTISISLRWEKNPLIILLIICILYPDADTFPCSFPALQNSLKGLTNWQLVFCPKKEVIYFYLIYSCNSMILNIPHNSINFSLNSFSYIPQIHGTFIIIIF